MNGYEESFHHRGSAYDRAMRAHPFARQEEFSQVIERARLAPGMLMADVPAGGGYLAAHLPSGVRWQGHEPCTSFQEGGGSHGAPTNARPLLPFPWANASIDRVVSLAGVHHQEDKLPFFREVRRVLAPDGLLVLSDVAAGSATAAFLDGYVGRHNSTGHEGHYLGSETIRELQAAGLVTVSDELVDLHWAFRDENALADFCSLLFDLSDQGSAGLLEAAREILGVDHADTGGCGLRWQLRTLVCRPD